MNGITTDFPVLQQAGADRDFSAPVRNSESSRPESDNRDFSSVLRMVQAQAQTSAGTGGGSAALSAGIPGDYLRGFSLPSNPAAVRDKPAGAAANSGQDGVIDRTSRLYAQSLELESYFVKIMLSSMRNTLSGGSGTGTEESFASRTYKDMLYDQLARTVTQNAGFGLADQIYLQLSSGSC